MPLQQGAVVFTSQALTRYSDLENLCQNTPGEVSTRENVRFACPLLSFAEAEMSLCARITYSLPFVRPVPLTSKPLGVSKGEITDP